jgi:beta-galactosidase
VRVTNEYDFVDLSRLVPTWTVEVDGVTIADGDLAPLDLAPQRSTELRIPVPARALEAGQRAHLTLTFVTADDRPWARAGHVVARRQFPMAVAPGPSVAPLVSDSKVREGASLADVEPTLALWRAPIDNENFGPVLRPHAARWERMGLRDAAQLVAMATTTEPDGAGAVCVTHDVVVPEAFDDIPRVGVRLRLGPGVHAVEWLGDGPHEGYSDRRESTRFGRWTTAVDDWPVPYVHPQASGNRTGVRWLRFLAADGAVLFTIDRLDGGRDGGLDVTVSRWRDDEVAAAEHLEDLPTRDDCYVWLDARHRGVGSAAVGPDVAPPHRVGPGPYRWSYRLR